MELGDDDVLFLVAGQKPARGKRLAWWDFPILVKRRAMRPPPVRELPPVPDIVLPSASPRGNGFRFPIDPEDFN
jgi:hypothetical protein